LDRLRLDAIAKLAFLYDGKLRIDEVAQMYQRGLRGFRAKILEESEVSIAHRKRAVPRISKQHVIDRSKSP
jgi:hypothetical protein